MHFVAAVALLVSSALAVPQVYGPAPAGPTSSASSAQQAAASAPATNAPGTVSINVAPGDNFVFSPANVTAPNGTVVTFFFPNAGLTHSVTQSSFAEPCTYLAASGSSPAGFDSGLVENVQFSINITNDQTPIWFHCKQVTHCGLGMVGSINAATTGSNTFQAFQAAAVQIGSSEPVETSGSFASGGVGAVATASPANTASSAPSSSSSGSSSGSGAVVGTSVNYALGLLSALAVVMSLL